MPLKKDPNLDQAGAYDEYKKWEKHNKRAIIITAAVALITFHLIWPAHVLALVGDTPIDERLAAAGGYFADLGRSLINPLRYPAFLSGYYFAWVKAVLLGQLPFSFAWVGWAMLVTAVGAAGMATNRNRKTPNVFGDARWATQGDIDEMEKLNRVGYQTPKLFVVGKFKIKNRWGREKHVFLRMGETLSVLLLAPPGTGKTAGFIVPSIVSMDEASLFVFDIKPELFDLTGGHRSTVGPVFQLKWNAPDEPNGTWVTEEQKNFLNPALLELDAQGKLVRDEISRYKTKPIFYPSWNPLSPKIVPPMGKRDMYFEKLANVLCPDPSAGEKFWAEKARVGLIGLMHFLCAKVEFASDPDLGGSWEGIPEQWHSHEASFPLMVDWFTHAQNVYSDGEGDDPMRFLFKAALAEAQKMNTAFTKKYGPNMLNRAIIELTSLMNAADKTRASILQTLDNAMAPFKNEAVRQRTSRSDFAFYELRGMPTPEARAREEAKVEAAKKQGKLYKPRYDKKTEFRPVTIYVSVNQEDAKALASITGTFIDAACAYLVANGPNSIDDQGNQLGPYDFGFMLDEAPQLPKLETVMQGPAVGRSKRVFFVIVGQDYGQFEEKYSKANVETLNSTTAIKVVLSQNNPQTAETVSKMAGKVTYTEYSFSEKQGGGKSEIFKGPILGNFTNLGGKKMSASERTASVEFLKASDIMSLSSKYPNKHIVLVQDYMSRPILATTPKYWIEPTIAAKAYNPRTLQGPPPAPPMPFDYMKLAQGLQSKSQEQSEAALERQERLNDPRHVIIATPRDIQSLTSDADGQMADLGTTYACAEIFLKPNECYVELPENDKVLVTDKVADVAAFVGKSCYFVFDDTLLESELNAKLRAAGLPALQSEFAHFINKRASDVGETAANNIYALGYQGGASLDLPDTPDKVTPQYAVRWIAEILSFVMGIEEQKRLFDL